jgi:GDP-L-fucose synthase
MADACVHLLGLPDSQYTALVKSLKPCLINIGMGRDITIKELAELVKKVVDFKGKIVFDTSKPDGTPQKLLDISRITQLGWQPQISLHEGLISTYRWYQENSRDRI